jgi:cytochrome P450
MVFVNTAAAAHALLGQKGSIYSDRPQPHFAMNVVGWRENPVFLPSGPRHKDARRMYSQEIGTRTSLQQISPMVDIETRKFVHRILDIPSERLLPEIQL